MADIKISKGGVEQDCGIFYSLHIDDSYATTIYRAHWNPKKWAIYYDSKTTLEGNTRLEVANAYIEHHKKMVAAMPKPQPTTLEVLLGMIKDAVAEHEKAEKLKADFETWGITSLEEGMIDEKNSCICTEFACPVTYLEQGYTGLTYACLPRELSYEADEKWKSYQPKDFELAYKSSEHYEPTTDSYMLSYDIPIDRENQDIMAVNYYKPKDKENKTETDLYSYSLVTAWVESNAGIDRPLSDDHRRSIGFCCTNRYLKTLILH